MNTEQKFLWDDLRYFVALGHNHTLKATAQNLGVEHSTVSRRISSLEKAIGMKLFDRLPKSWSMTEQGKELFDYALSMEKSAADFVVKAEAINPLSSKIRISAPPILISHFFALHHAGLKQKIAGVNIEWIGEKRKANLNTGEADIAIRLGNLEDSSLKMRRLGEVEYAVYSGQNKNISEASFIDFSSSSINAELHSWYKNKISDQKIYAEADDFLTIAQLIKTSDAKGLLPVFLAESLNDIVRDEQYSDMPTVSAYLLIHADIAKKPLVKRVAEELVTLFREKFKY